MQQSVKMRPPSPHSLRYGNLVGNAPLEFPTLSKQIEEKKRQRSLMEMLKMNEKLSEDDSDLSQHSSVGSDKIKRYIRDYKL